MTEAQSLINKVKNRGRFFVYISSSISKRGQVYGSVFHMPIRVDFHVVLESELRSKRQKNILGQHGSQHYL
jgi:hypothetical protein